MAHCKIVKIKLIFFSFKCEEKKIFFKSKNYRENEATNASSRENRAHALNIYMKKERNRESERGLSK